MISQDLTWFGVHGFLASGNVMYSVCFVTSKDHLIEGSCEFRDGSSSQYVTTLTSLVTIDIVIVEIKCAEFVT